MNSRSPNVAMLMAMLKHIEYVASRRDRYIHPDTIRTCLLDGTATMIKGNWGDSRNSPLDLADKSTWNTSMWTGDGEYLDIVFSVNEGRLECKVKMYKGCFPAFFAIEFEATLSFEPKCIEMLRNSIVEDFERSMKARHKAYRAEKKRKWMEDEGRRVLGDERYLMST